jgi:hypothetical protein
MYLVEVGIFPVCDLGDASSIKSHIHNQIGEVLLLVSAVLVFDKNVKGCNHRTSMLVYMSERIHSKWDSKAYKMGNIKISRL